MISIILGNNFATNLYLAYILLYKIYNLSILHFHFHHHNQ